MNSRFTTLLRLRTLWFLIVLLVWVSVLGPRLLVRRKPAEFGRGRLGRRRHGHGDDDRDDWRRL